MSAIFELYIPYCSGGGKKSDQFYLDILGKYLLRDMHGMSTIFRVGNEKCTERH